MLIRLRRPFASLVAALCAVVASNNCGDAGASDLMRYRLVEEWSVAAQGPVHLREKRVSATYELDVTSETAVAPDRKSLTVHVARVVVEADVPAQKRSGRFDSRTMNADPPIQHHELIRPLALLGQDVTLRVDADGSLRDVAGTESAIRRLDDLYDRHLRGSEQDLHTREFERQQLVSEMLGQTWLGYLVSPATSDSPVVTVDQSPATVEVVACIPSESWMRRVALPVNRTVRRSRAADGRLAVETSAVLAPAQIVRTSIGGVAWEYFPEQVRLDATQTVDSDGLVQELRSSTTAILATTLSLGKDVPIRMTIRHQVELTPR